MTMELKYLEIPHNWSKIEKYVVTDADEIARVILSAAKIVFYDTCSFRFHSKVPEMEQKIIRNFFKKTESSVIITRCVLMELASHSGKLNDEYVCYFKQLYETGIKILILNEEDVYNVLSVCFSTNKAINGYLSWAVRMMNKPISTIKHTLDENPKLHNEIIKAKNLSSSHIYNDFFTKVRKNKESGDNLGEELIAICVHILSHLPGTKDGKYCFITDDKEAVGKIVGLLNRTNKQYAGAKVIPYSTPKLIQTIYNQGMSISKDDMITILTRVSNSNIVIMGTREYDIRVNDSISVTAYDLADMIMTPNMINILF